MDSHKESLGSFTAEEYEQYRLLIHKVARRHYGILLHTDFPEEYEDVYQSVVVSFLQAKNKFDPDRGFKFTTYAVASADKNLMTTISRSKKRKVPMTSLESLRSKDDDVSFWEEFISDESCSGYKPSLRMKLEEATKNIKKLSPAARLVVRELIAPSEEIRKAHKEKVEFAKKAKESGNSVPLVKPEIDYGFIFRYYNISSRKRKSIHDEIKKVFEL